MTSVTRDFFSIFKSVLVACFTFSIFEASVFGGVFPNYFAELAPTEAEVFVSKAVSSLFKRIQVPHVQAGRIVLEQFFERLEYQVHEKDPDAQILISGEGAQNLLAYLYRVIHQAKLKDPKVPIKAILSGIINAKDPIDLSPFGVATQLKVLIVPSEKGKRIEEQIIYETKEFIESVRISVQRTGQFSTFSYKSKKYPIVSMLDVVDYEKEMSALVSLGGSTLDWLSFQVPNGKIVLPKRAQSIIEEMLGGHYQYFPPTDLKKVKDYDRQVIRAVAPLVQLPFLRLADSSKKELEKSFQQMSQKIRKGDVLSSSAFRELGNIIQNAQFLGTQDKLQLSSDDLDRLVVQFFMASARENRLQSWIPEFTFRADSKLTEGKDLCGLEESRFLVNTDDFFNNYTAQGIVFRNDLSTESILSFFRKALINGENNAIASFKQNFIELKIKKGIPLRILDWEKVKNFQKLRQARVDSDHKKINFFTHFAKSCGIDVIVNDRSAFIQNVGVVDFPPQLNDWISDYRNKMDSVLAEYQDELRNYSAADVKNILSSILAYRPFHDIGLLLQLESLKPASDLFHRMKDFLESDSSYVRRAAVRFLPFIASNPDSHVLFKQALKDSEVSVRKLATDALMSYQGEQLYSLFKQALSDKEQTIRAQVVDFLPEYRGDSSLALFKQALSDGDKDIRSKAVQAMKVYEGTDKYAWIKFGIHYFASHHTEEIGNRRIISQEICGYQGGDSSPLFEIILDHYPYSEKQSVLSCMQDNVLLKGNVVRYHTGIVPSRVYEKIIYYALKNEEAGIRKMSAGLIQDYCKSGKGSLGFFHDALKRTLEDKEYSVRQMSVASLFDCKEILNIFDICHMALQDENSLIREDAIGLLKERVQDQKIAQNPKTLRLLIMALEDKSSAIREGAAELLKKLTELVKNSLTPESQAILREYLDSESGYPIQESVSSDDFNKIKKETKKIDL